MLMSEKELKQRELAQKHTELKKQREIEYQERLEKLCMDKASLLVKSFKPMQIQPPPIAQIEREWVRTDIGQWEYQVIPTSKTQERKHQIPDLRLLKRLTNLNLEEHDDNTDFEQLTKYGLQGNTFTNDKVTKKKQA